MWPLILKESQINVVLIPREPFFSFSNNKQKGTTNARIWVDIVHETQCKIYRMSKFKLQETIENNYMWTIFNNSGTADQHDNSNR